MIKREELDKIPTAVREKLVSYIERRLKEREDTAISSSQNFVLTLDESHRSLALHASGEVQVLKEFYNLFK